MAASQTNEINCLVLTADSPIFNYNDMPTHKDEAYRVHREFDRHARCHGFAPTSREYQKGECLRTLSLPDPGWVVWFSVRPAHAVSVDVMPKGVPEEIALN